ncbi:cytidine deaminase [Halomontanus rarus]|uniref:cytidine deaminase n=1 Tax=Halomontanus rarus TaxID=3034020 RepID=UPI001A9990D9
METHALTSDDEALVAHATETCERTFDPDFFDGAHIVAAAVRTTDGDVYDGVSLPASVGSASSCGEPVAVGSAVADGVARADLETCVAVAYPMAAHDADEVRVVPPCGTCRELLADYRDDLRVIVPVDGDDRVARAIDLLPTRTW